MLPRDYPFCAGIENKENRIINPFCCYWIQVWLTQTLPSTLLKGIIDGREKSMAIGKSYHYYECCVHIYEKGLFSPLWITVHLSHMHSLTNQMDYILQSRTVASIGFLEMKLYSNKWMNPQFFPWATSDTLKFYGHTWTMHGFEWYFRMGKRLPVISAYVGVCVCVYPFASYGFGNNNFCFVIIQWYKVLHKQKPPPSLLLHPFVTFNRWGSTKNQRLPIDQFNLMQDTHIYINRRDGNGASEASFEFSTHTQM